MPGSDEYYTTHQLLEGAESLPEDSPKRVLYEAFREIMAEQLLAEFLAGGDLEDQPVYAGCYLVVSSLGGGHCGAFNVCDPADWEDPRQELIEAILAIPGDGKPDRSAVDSAARSGTKTVALAGVGRTEDGRRVITIHWHPLTTRENAVAMMKDAVRKLIGGGPASN